jgi:hypothetical protein
MDVDRLRLQAYRYAVAEVLAALETCATTRALRSSQERGALPYKHLWDGRSLRAVGE